jgi:hypothetical protein
MARRHVEHVGRKRPVLVVVLVLLCGAVLLTSLWKAEQRKPVEQDAVRVAAFKYCTGLTNAAEFAAHRQVIAETESVDLRAKQQAAFARLNLPPTALMPGNVTLRADASGGVTAVGTLSDLDRGLEDGAEMVDAGAAEKLRQAMARCASVFDTISG